MKNLFTISGLQSGFVLVLALFVMSAGDAVFAGEFTQPIKFSHKTHAGTNEIPCEFCHIYARRSISSGIPPVRTCFGCHQVVKGTDATQQAEIQKVVDHWQQKKVIPWKKIHDLPDFVYFSHKRHIQAGFDCTECHGEINKLDEINMDNMKPDLSMGWCVTCHKTKHPAHDGKIIGPIRATRGGNPVQGAAALEKNGVVQGSKDCFICHK